jgi:hypothetical protein
MMTSCITIMILGLALTNNVECSLTITGHDVYIRNALGVCNLIYCNISILFPIFQDKGLEDHCNQNRMNVKYSGPRTANGVRQRFWVEYASTEPSFQTHLLFN